MSKTASSQGSSSEVVRSTKQSPDNDFVPIRAVPDLASDLTEAEREAGFITFGELQELPKTPWLIDGVIRQGSLTFLYGRPDTFKTFLALDMCGALMAGRAWLDADVTKSGPVLYLAAEGSETLVERMKAWEIHHETIVPPEGFQVVRNPPDLTDGEGMDALCEALKCRPYSLVVIDTFGKSLGWADENSNSDINRALLRVAKIKDLGIAVVLIHHSGHSADRLRGASAMYGAVDTIIKAEVVGELLVKLSCERQRRSRPFEPIYTQLSELEIGTDEQGRPETSLAVVGRTSKVKGLMVEHLARRQGILDYLSGLAEHEAKQSDIVHTLGLRMNGSARQALFEGLADDGFIEKVDSAGKALVWRLVG
jgi:archaellum biogenesis ATPase FlaH